jgi:hypothetical protein
MSVAITDGILGVESQMNWNGGAAILNAGGFPRAKVNRITGLHDLPDADDNRENNTGYAGEQPYVGHARGRTIVYEGVLKAQTLPQLRAYGNALRAAFQDRSGEKVMTHAPHVTWGAISHFFYARVINWSSPEDQTSYSGSAMPTPWQRPFVLTLRQSDPRYYVTGLNISNEVASAGSWEAHNAGLMETPPIFHIKGALADATVLLARGGGANLRFDDITLGVGEWMIVDFRQRYAYNEQTGEDLTGHINLTYSNWWDEGMPGLRPATHEDVGVTGAAWILDWYHANP